jgi:hypothetical protein
MIIVDEGRRLRVPEGRPAAMIRWLIEHRDQIERAGKIKLTFDFAGKRTTASVQRHFKVK